MPVLVLLILALLGGCQMGLYRFGGAAEDLAKSKGWPTAYFDAGHFVLTGFRKPGTNPGGIAHIYIEGDGYAFSSARRISPDPTPKEAVALEMAVGDSHPAVLYLARPCQFTRPDTQRNCASTYWSLKRFAPEVIEAADLAIDQYKRAVGAERLVLFGYSGGATVAALVAARRSDVIALVTAAGTMDHAAWTGHHKVTPLSGSLSPATEIARLSALPQVHYAGAKDTVVPSSVVSAFADRFPPARRPPVEVVPGFDHTCCWGRDWASLLARARARLATQGAAF